MKDLSELACRDTHAMVDGLLSVHRLTAFLPIT